MRWIEEKHVLCLHESCFFEKTPYDVRHQREEAKRIRAGMTKRSGESRSGFELA